MRILFLAHRIPYPPDKGDKIRSFHELKALAARGHHVHLLAFADDVHDLPYEADLGRICTSVRIVRLRPLRARLRSLRALTRSSPLSLGYFGCRTMRREVALAIERTRPEAVVVYSAAMAQYVPGELACRTVVDLVDADSEKWREYAPSAPIPLSWIYRTESCRLRAYEQSIVRRFASTVVSTEREKAVLARGEPGAPALPVHVIGNGVDLERYCPTPQPDPQSAAPRLVFTGAMDYYPNVDAVCSFVHDVLPAVRHVRPATELFIVGRNPTAAVRRLGGVGGVTVTGTVPDVRPYLRTALVVVVPLRVARGIQNKVLEAMAMGCAIVATPEAVAALNVRPGRHLLVGSSPRELAEAILLLGRDGMRRRAVQGAARAYVEQHHQWTPILRQFTSLVEDAGVQAVPA